MILVDGEKSEKKISDYDNLEELIKELMEDKRLEGRVVTDVLVNNECFSEIYPHQAEDMSCDEIESVEVRSVPMSQMAMDISGEMGKVAKLMAGGARNVARLLREGSNTDAMELFQDMLDVTRDFMSLVGNLRDKYLLDVGMDLSEQTEKFSDLLSEMSDVLANEDWILLADLLEYEFLPVCNEWETTSEEMHEKMVKIAGL